MTDGRVLAALQTALGAGVPVRAAFSEAPAAVPRAVLRPAVYLPLCLDGTDILLTEGVQQVALAAHSYAQLTQLCAQAETAMRTLGYRLADVQPAETPRGVTMTFRAVFDAEGNVYDEGVTI